jgi:hypothetical protein
VQTALSLSIVFRYPISAGTVDLFQLKSGRTSAPRLPQAAQAKRGSISDSGISSGPAIRVHRHRMAAMVVGAIDRDVAHAHVAAHIAERDFPGSRRHPGIVAR